MIYAADAEVEFSDDKNNYDEENSETEEESSDNSVDLIEDENNSYENEGEDIDNVTIEEEEESHDSITDTNNDNESEFSDGEDIWSDGSDQVLFVSEVQSATPEYDVWLSDTIVSGLSMDGTVYGDSMYTLFKQMQEPIYAELGGLLLEDVPLMSISSVWNNVVKREFYTNQKLIYETLLIEYIKHENKTNASLFDTTQVDRANSYLIKMFNELADGGVQDWSPDKFMEMTVEEAVQSFQNVQGVKTAIERAQSVSENVQELFKLTSSILATNDVKEEKVQLIKNARDACASMKNPNKDFINACDEIIEAIESTDIDINYIKTQVASVIRQKAIDKVWGNLCDKNPILKSIDWTADAMDILFNTSDAATNNLKLSILYTMDCYFKMGLSNAATQYLNHKTDNTAAQTFDSCFEGYVNFQIYGNDTAKSWISSVHDDGALNHAFTYIFCREALTNASELKNLCDSQNKTRNQMLNIISKYQDIYSNLYMKDEYKEAMSAPITPTPTIDPKDYKISEGITSSNPVEDSGKCGDSAYWKLFKDGTLIIHGMGEMYGRWRYHGWDNASEIKKIEITEGVTVIGFQSFKNCVQLKSVTIPNTVEKIGGYAFCNCIQLKSITIPNTVKELDEYIFQGCTQLEDITIPASVKECYGGIFRECVNLKTVGSTSGNYNIKLEFTETIPSCLFEMSEIEEVSIPGTVKNISYRLFSYCKKLKKVKLSSGLTTIEQEAFGNCVQLKSITIPNTVKEIGMAAFDSCTSLTSVTGGNKLETIGFGAFENCTQLESITIPASVKECDSGIFYKCTNLKTVGPAIGNYNIKLEFTEIIPQNLFYNSEIEEVSIPDTVKKIDYNAFYACNSLKKIKLSSELKFIEACAFNECSNLITVIGGDKIERIGGSAFRRCIQLKSISISNTVKNIGGYAFDGCSNLTTITIGRGSILETIGDNAFSRCVQLKQLTIPVNVKTIGRYVFGGCSNLITVTIEKESTLEAIDDGAFSGCVQLKQLIIPVSVKKIGGYAFRNCTEFTLYGYSGSYGQSYAKQHNIPFVILTEATPKPTATPVIPTGKFAVKLSAFMVAYNGKAQTPSITVTYKGKKLSNKYYTVKYTNNKNIGTATVTVTGKGTYKKCLGKATFKIVLRTGAISSLKAGKKYITLNWKTITGSTGYQIQYSTSKNFAKAKTVKIAGVKKYSTTIKKLASKKTYYVRVRAYRTANRKTVYGSWSGSKKVVVK